MSTVYVRKAAAVVEMEGVAYTNLVNQRIDSGGSCERKHHL